MFTEEEKIRAIELYFKYGKKLAAVIREPFDISAGETSASYSSLNAAAISRVVIPLAYNERIWLSILVIRV